MNKISLSVLTLLFLSLLSVIAQAETIRYVKQSSTGDGSSWQSASADLQAMINASNEGDKVYVAAGTYKPNAYPSGCDGCTSNQHYTFQLKSGVKIYGGFPASGSPTFEQRNWNTNVTKLSGDFDDDDVVTGSGETLNITGNSENAYHVVLSVNTDQTLLDGFLVTGGFAGDSYPIIISDEFFVYKSYGGGIYNLNSNGEYVNCRIYGNSAGGDSGENGGGVYNEASVISLNKCKIEKNISTVYGGGISNLEGSVVTVTECLFSGNSATFGAGLQIEGGKLNVNKCVFDGNYSAMTGGGMLLNNVVAAIVNTVFYKNKSGGSSGISMGGGDLKIANCTFTGNNSAGVGAALSSQGSTVIINTIISDNTGDRQISNDGAYTFDMNHSIIKNESFPGIGNLSLDPLFVNINDGDGPDDLWGTADDGLRLATDSPAVNAGTNTNAPVTDILGNPIYKQTKDMGAYEQLDVIPAPVFLHYVKQTPSGLQDGTSWDNASSDLQAMLNASVEGGKVYVAKGVYKPASYPLNCNGCSTGRDYTFQLKSGVKVYGGFPGTGSPTFDQRDWRLNVTVLSGDFNGDDVITGSGETLGITGNSENANHVVLSVGNDAETLLDGFVITGGSSYAGADASIDINGDKIGRDNGGAIYNLKSGTQYINCTISGNSAFSGGGLYNWASAISLSKCKIEKNKGRRGGGIFSGEKSLVTMSDCVIRGNTSIDAVVVSSESDISTNKSVFEGNYVASGSSSLANTAGNTTLLNTIFYKNKGDIGAVLLAQSKSAKVANCVFVGNKATSNSAIQINGSESTVIVNSIFWKNTSINSAEQIANNGSGTPGIHHNIIEGPSVFSEGNLNSDPLFIDMEDGDGPDNIWGTADDGLRLKRNSPAVDAGTNTDAPETDILDNPVHRFIKDMGAYEQAGEEIYYVKQIAGGREDGTSWENASSDLQAMINGFHEGDRIYVAKGTYKPTSYPAGCVSCNSDRDYTFHLKNGVKIYGGFPDSGSPTFAERDWSIYSTTLSGDFNGNDLISGKGETLNITGNSENAYHVVLSVYNTKETLMDGFFITGGLANGSDYIQMPGFIYRNNGGGIYNFSSKAQYINCSVFGNSIVSTLLATGGGIYNSGSQVSVLKSKIERNLVNNYASGIGSVNSVLTISDCIVSDNKSGAEGGAITSSDGAVNINKSVIAENEGAAAINVVNGSLDLINSIIYNNSLSGMTRGSYSSGDTKIINCTFATDKEILLSPIRIDGSYSIMNTIFSMNAGTLTKPPIVYGGDSQLPELNHSIVDVSNHPYPGQANLIGVDPLFVNIKDGDGPDNVWGTADDGLRLKRNSPAIDAGTNTNAPENDILGNPIFRLVKDMGAYEQQEDFDVYSGTEDCQTLTLENVSGDQWYYFRNASGLVAALNPNGADLGTVTLQISDSDGAVSYNNAKFLGRSVNITSSNYNDGAVIPANYNLRLYFYNSELEEYNQTETLKIKAADLNIAWKGLGAGCTLESYAGKSTGFISHTALNTGNYGEENNAFYLQLSLNHFTLFVATAASESALPVRLVSFTGSNKGDYNLLKWQTSSETNNAYFHIERSGDGINFEHIGELVAGAGDSKSLTSYVFQDKTFQSAVNYYRLKQVDTDGKFEYSRIIAVKNQELIPISVYPNPVKSALLVDSKTGDFEYSIINTSGQMQLKGKSKAGQSIPVSALQQGIYLIRVNGQAIKFVKE